MRKTGKNKSPARNLRQCAGCALRGHDAYICIRWRRGYAVNEIKKKLPILRRYAVADMRCPYRWPGDKET